MQVFDIAELSQDIPKVLNTALVDEVIINDKGNQYKLLPIKENNRNGKSPLEDIPRIKLNISTQEIVEILNDCRAGL